MYKILIKPILFLFKPEAIHHLVFMTLKFISYIPGTSAIIRAMYAVKDDRLSREVFGLTFDNPVGLAAGLDKNARHFRELAGFGFGFIEIGTVTPLPQKGNPKPRLFRLPADEALINRMGFNNDGVGIIAKRLSVCVERPARSFYRQRNRIIIGCNIGKNAQTPNKDAVNDYEKCFETLFDFADYFVVNVSSPNTPGLQKLQDKEPLTVLLSRLKELNNAKKKPKPILLKISPDLTDEQLDDIIEIVKTLSIDGVIATNTTIKREGLIISGKKAGLKVSLPDCQLPTADFQLGGLSGKPLAKRSTEVIRYLSKKSNKAFPIIGVGGIHSPEDALEKLKAGADLIQIYTGFIYEGPSLIKKINQRIIVNSQIHG